MDKQSYHVTVNRLRMISSPKNLMVYLELSCDDGTLIHALNARRPLEFMLEVQVGDVIEVYGHFNQRQQFIIEHYLSPNREYNRRLKDTPPHLNYPPERRERKE